MNAPRQQPDWQSMPDGPEKYAAYLCSHEWAVRRSAARKRSGGKCERCKQGDAKHCHHLTYIRKYNELLEDLWDVCPGCHAWIHDHSKEDPIEYWKQMNRDAKPYFGNMSGHVQCPLCREWENNCVHHSGTFESIKFQVRSDTKLIHVTGDQRNSTAYPGQVLRVKYWCECGCVFHWHIQNHKGQTFFDVWMETNFTLSHDDRQYEERETELSEFWKKLS